MGLRKLIKNTSIYKWFNRKERKAIIIEVIDKLLLHINRDNAFICNSVEHLKVSKKDADIFMEYFLSCYPMQNVIYRDFLDSKAWVALKSNPRSGDAWWMFNEVDERVRFLKAIKNNL